MKAYIVKSQLGTAVVGVNDTDTPFSAVRKYLRSLDHNDNEIYGYTTYHPEDEYCGTWKNQSLEGTYTLREFIV